MDCRREGGGIAGSSCCTAPGASPPPNMASMVGRSAAPKGVDIKSEGRSVWWWFESQISEGNESRIFKKRAFDP